MPLLSREDLRKQVKDNQIAPVYLLFGEETFLRDQAARAITEKVMKDQPLREFNDISVSLANTDIQQAIAAAEQMPMLAQRRVVRITELNKLTREADEEVLMRYVARPADSSVLILLAEDLDKRKKLSKNLLETAAATEFPPLAEGELAHWAQTALRDAKAEADDRTINHLIGLIGSDVRVLTNEINKLATAALPSGQITFELVDELVANSRQLSNFELTDYLLAKNRRRALQILRKILDDKAEPLMLLGLIASNYHRLAWAKEAMARGAERAEVFRTIKLPPFKHEDFLAIARRASANDLARALQRIAVADLNIKTSIGGANGARLQIEMLVCELTA